jgi:L-alanine-DL-glutamate epimerase-like enolase superfamily enzyme
LRIANVETLCLSQLYEPENQWFTYRFRAIKADCALVRVTTDDGAVGIGEACAYGDPLRIRDWVQWLAQALIGRTLEDAWRFVRPNGLTWAHDCAVAGVDCALWDLLGKREGRPSRSLLGDRPSARVELYASSGCRYDWRADPTQLIEETLEYVDSGFHAVKIRLGTEWEWDGVTPERFLGLMETLRAAVGDRVRLMVDGNQRLSRDTALDVARGLDTLGFAWFEEPIPQDDVEGFAQLNRAVETPITGGERLTTIEQFRPFLELRAVDVVQPDAGWCGISEALAIADLAASHGIGVCPHNWHNGALTFANAQIVAAAPAGQILELSMIQGPLQNAVVSGGLPVQAGMLELDDRPGLGFDIPADLEERFPYIEGYFAVEMTR